MDRVPGWCVESVTQWVGPLKPPNQKDWPLSFLLIIITSILWFCAINKLASESEFSE